jgi:hypothetical protein
MTEVKAALLKFYAAMTLGRRGGLLMDVTAIAAAATQMSQARTANAVQLAVLKLAMDVQSQGALQLLQAVTPAAGNPPHLGNAVDTYA